MKISRSAPLLAALLAACGGSSTPAPGFAVKGTVTGLAGSNLVLHLGPAAPGQDLAVSAPGPFTFPVALPDGAAYAVTVKTQPGSPSQTCAVSGGTGAVAGADVTVQVSCTTDRFTVGGTVSGLLGGTLVLQNGGADDLAVTADGPFTFPATVASGAAFAVTVAQQPEGPVQTCLVAGGTGTVAAGPVTSVAVSCEPSVKPVAGTITGLAGATGVVLTVNGGFDTTLTSNGAFEVPTSLRAGQAWSLAVATQPTTPWQTCAVSGGTGVMGATGAGGVSVTCATDLLAVGGAASGVLQPGLSVSLTIGGAGAPAETIAPAADGSLAFTTRVTSGVAFQVKVEASPATQACAVTAPADVVAGTAVMAGAPVAVTIACACAPGLASCSQATQDGCETQLLTDPLHCGSCDVACSFTGASAACDAGQCRLAACNPGRGDCDLSAANGCEADFASDPAHCGACLNACSFQNAAATCASSTCALAACNAGFGDCNLAAADGCETSLATTPAHCGACNRPCNLPNVSVATCAAATCGVGTCSPGFGNCDGAAANGCESDFSSDALNCGACGQDCSYTNGVGACVTSQCQLSGCLPGFDSCDGQAANGCETSTASSGTNCGSCGHVCSLPNAAPSCGGGLCNTAQCLAGFGDCDGAAANGCERPTSDDPLNCGGCANACASDRVCAAGACTLARSCRELLVQRPGSASGQYTIDPDGAGAGAPIQVYCDMTYDGGGWTFFAHLGNEYQAGPLFTVDLGTYLPDRSAPKVGPPAGLPDTRPTVSYGLGASVYGKIGATELMISARNMDPATTVGSSLVFYKFGVGHLSFKTGPAPCDPTDPAFQYRTILGSYSAGLFGVCDFTEWQPWSTRIDAIDGLVADEPLIVLTGAIGNGTSVGSGVDPLLLPGDLSSGWDSWWYAR